MQKTYIIEVKHTLPECHKKYIASRFRGHAYSMFKSSVYDTFIYDFNGVNLPKKVITDMMKLKPINHNQVIYRNV